MATTMMMEMEPEPQDYTSRTSYSEIHTVSTLEPSRPRLFSRSTRLRSSSFRGQAQTRVFLSLLAFAVMSLRFQANLPDIYFGQFSRRSTVDHNEFMHRGASAQEIEEFFRFDPNGTNAENETEIQHLWRCSEDPNTRHKKLIYLQMWRSAGITIRALLRGYAHYCHVGIATVSRCVDLGREFMEGEENWKNGHVSPRPFEDCSLGRLENRTGFRIPGTLISTARLEQHQVDCLAGQLPIGVDEFWRDESGNHVQTQYVIFLREPLRKFVSSQIFFGSNLTNDELFDRINATVWNMTWAGKYRDSYTNYLITPAQTSWVEFEHVNLTQQRRLMLAKANLVKLNVVVGIFERLLESLSLLQYVVDADQQVTALFQYFSSSESAMRVINTHSSGNRTNELVERIHEDPALLARMKEFLKYENEMYDFGLAIHERQVEAVRSRGWVSKITPGPESGFLQSNR